MFVWMWKLLWFVVYVCMFVGGDDVFYGYFG